MTHAKAIVMESTNQLKASYDELPMISGVLRRFSSNQSSNSFGSESNELRSPSTSFDKGSTRIAVCLCGGARQFEVSGLSIKRNLLLSLGEPDTFLNVPLDANTKKLPLLQGTNIVAVRIIAQAPIYESQQIREVLRLESPTGVQGLLQYFGLVEGCEQLISDHEWKHGFKYMDIEGTR
jgi:hypothetical protein